MSDNKWEKTIVCRKCGYLWNVNFKDNCTSRGCTPDNFYEAKVLEVCTDEIVFAKRHTSKTLIKSKEYGLETAQPHTSLREITEKERKWKLNKEGFKVYKDVK